MEGEIGKCLKRKDSGEIEDGVERSPTKFPAMFTDGEEDAEEEEEGKGVEIEEEAVAEVMKFLEQEINCPSGLYYQSPAFITINGNEESCGPSFSDFASTVMASIDTRGGVGVSYFMGDQSGPAFPTEWVNEMIPAAPSPASAVVEEEESDGEFLARVIGGAAFEMGDFFS